MLIVGVTNAIVQKDSVVTTARTVIAAHTKVHTKDYFKGKRLCRYCGINIDIPDLDILEFIHGECWKIYRAKGYIYPMPANVG